MTTYRTLSELIGNTPLVALQRIGAADNTARNNLVLGKLEGNNPAGSVKDRAALSMISRAQERGDIAPGDTLIEATSGNTGIALAMAAAILGYRMVLIMPEDLSIERAQTRIHVETTGPEIWRDTEGGITHFVSAMGTTGTISGVGRYLKQQNPAVRIIGAQPAEGSRIPGIRKWSPEYVPKIYDAKYVDEIRLVSQADAEEMARRMAREEGIFAGISAAGACCIAQQIASEVCDATIVFIVCDRGDRYLSTGVFPA